MTTQHGYRVLIHDPAGFVLHDEKVTDRQAGADRLRALFATQTTNDTAPPITWHAYGARASFQHPLDREWQHGWVLPVNLYAAGKLAPADLTRFFVVHTGFAGYLPDNSYGIIGTLAAAIRIWQHEIRDESRDYRECGYTITTDRSKPNIYTERTWAKTWWEHEVAAARLYRRPVGGGGEVHQYVELHELEPTFYVEHWLERGEREEYKDAIRSNFRILDAKPAYAYLADAAFHAAWGRLWAGAQVPTDEPTDGLYIANPPTD